MSTSIMRTQAFPIIGVLCGLLTVVTAVPAVKYSDISGNCGVTTVYVTVPPPTENTRSEVQLSKSPFVNYGGIGNPDSGLHTTSKTYLTSTAHQTILVTKTLIGPGYTRTETTLVTYPTPSSPLAEFTLQSNPENIFGTSTTDALTASKPVTTIAPSIITSYGNQVFSTITNKVQIICSGDLVTCPEASFADSLVGSSTGSSTVPLVVYTIQTLTVIPLETPPTVVSSIYKASAVVNTLSSTEEVPYMQGYYVSATSTSSDVYAAGPTGTASFTPYSRIHLKSAAGGWNSSVSFTSAYLNSPSIATSIYSTFTADAVLGSSSPTSTSSSMSIDFADSFISPYATSHLDTQSGFTAFFTSTSFSATATSPSSAGIKSLVLLSSNLSRTSSDRTWAESYLATSTMDAVRSSAMATLTSSNLSLATADAAWTESYSELDSMTSAGKSALSTFMADAVSTSSSFASVSYNSPSSSINSTTTTTIPTTSTSTASETVSVYLSSTGILSSGSMTSEASPDTPVSSGSTVSSSSPPLEAETSTGPVLETSTSSSSKSLSAPALTSTTSLVPVDDYTKSSIEPTTTQSMTTSSVLTFTTLTSSVPSLNPTACGGQAIFTLNFDDIPPLATKDNSTAQPEPIFSPYHQFYFSDGFTVVPPPTDPYLPSSGHLLLEFLADSSFALGYTGSIGNGRTESLGCFNFNALGMSLGCDSTGYGCDWQFTGYRYNNASKAVDQVTTQKVTTAACPGLSNCNLVPISLDSTFKSLTELHINVTVGGVEKIWWMDDLNLSWYNDSCDSEACRETHA